METARKEITGLHRITKKRILELCKKQKLYQTPSLNDVLYLHYQGFQYIECLEEYTELKCIWLESNAISEIEGLDNQPKLKCLFLHNNLIKSIANLQHCVELDTINLASNHITKIENCGSDILPVLNTLNLASNYLQDSESLKELENCRTLSILDLSNNRIDDILVVKIFAKMPQLRVLVLKGNPVVSRLPQYRKTMILECKELTYLDSRPVFLKDRACCEAWKRGGYDEERKENERWNRRERKKIRDSVNATINLRNKHKGPEDQRPLLSSSDSDGEIDNEQHRRQTEIDFDVNMEMGLWDDVADAGDTKSETLSDIIVSSSSTSIISTDSNGNGSLSGLKAAASAEIQCNENGEQKLRNDSPKTNQKIIEITDNDNVANILKIVTAEDTVDKSEEFIKKTEVEERTKKVKFVDEIEMEVEAEHIKSEDKDENITINQSKYKYSDRNDILEGEEEYKEVYEEAANAICSATMNDLSPSGVSPSKRPDLQIETLNILEGQDYEPEIMTVDDSEEKMRQQIREENAKAPESPKKLVVRKTVAQIIYESECHEINNKLERDLEELIRNMDILTNELKMEDINDDTNYETSSSNFDDSNSTQESQLDELEQQFELTGTKKEIKNVALEYNEKGLPLEVILEVDKSETDILISKQAACAGHSDAKSGNVLDGDEINDVEEETLLRANTETITDIEVAFEKVFNVIWEDNEHSINLRENYNLNSIEEELSSSSENKSVGIIDKSIKVELDTDDHKVGIADTNGTLAEVSDRQIQCEQSSSEGSLSEPENIQETYKNEAKELRNLLQKLEDENEKLYNLNCTYRIMLDQDIETERKYLDHAVSDTIEKLCEDIVDEFLDDLDLEEVEKQQQQKTAVRNYQFPDIESDEEYSYTDIKPPEEPVKTINEVLTSFNNFLREIASNNRESRQQNEWSRPRVTHTEEEKAGSLQKLLQSTGSQPIFPESPESVDEELVAMKKRQKKQVRKIVDRVYAQRDKYDDSLDVVDGKLVVVKKDTGDIEDLPEKLLYKGSDNDEYDTAQSTSDEESGAAGGWDVYGNDEDSKSKPRGRWIQKYKPTPRTSAEHLINEALERNRSESGMDEAENYEYNSLHSAETDYEKLFANIDEEFFSLLDLNNVQMDEDDENEIGSCATSCDELRQYIRKDAAELCATGEEDALLEKMKMQEEEERPATDSANDKLTEKENILLKKMVDRQRDIEGYERQNIEMTDMEAMEDMAMQRIAQHETKMFVANLVKIFEFNIDNKEELEHTQKKIQMEDEELIADKVYKNMDDDLKEFVDAEMAFYNIEQGRIIPNIDDEDEFNDIHEEEDTSVPYLKIHKGVTASKQGELEKVNRNSEYEFPVITQDMDTGNNVNVSEILTETEEVILPQILKNIVAEQPIGTPKEVALNILESIFEGKEMNFLEKSITVTSEYPEKIQILDNLNILEPITEVEEEEKEENEEVIISEISERESSNSVVPTEFVQCEPPYEKEFKDEKSYGDTISNDVDPIIGTEITEFRETERKEMESKEETPLEEVENKESQQRPEGVTDTNYDIIFDQIEVNLEIINDNDEVVNELTVNADIIYDI